MSEVGENFRGKYGNNPICPMDGCNERDSQRHLGECQVLQRETGLVLEDDHKYEDLFGKEATKVLTVAKFLEMSLQKRTQIIESRQVDQDV